MEQYPLDINVISSYTKMNVLDYDLSLNLGFTEFLFSKGAKADVTSDIFMEALLVALSNRSYFYFVGFFNLFM